jgi:undecaprenyl-diphosphatase
MRWLRAEGPRVAGPRWARLLEWDRACTLLVNRALAARYERLWLAIDRLGEVWTWLGVIFAIGAFGGAAGPGCALHMFLAGSAAVICYKLVKNLACRARPCVMVDGVLRCADPLDEFSFPSGHVLHATTFILVAIAYYPPLAVVLLPYLVLVAISRVALGLHYPSDVAAGAFIGAAVALASFAFT